MTLSLNTGLKRRLDQSFFKTVKVRNTEKMPIKQNKYLTIFSFRVKQSVLKNNCKLSPITVIYYKYELF